MLTEVRKQIRISAMSIKYALMRSMLNKAAFISDVIFMILNNATFIIQWVVIFSIKDNIGGYTLKEVLLIWGMASFTYGISHLFFYKAYDLSEIINSGKLDAYLVQPKNVLLSVITSDVSPSAIGDLLYGIIILFIYGFTIKNFLLYMLFGICGGIVMVAISVIFNSLAFWINKADILAERFNGFMTVFATYPDGIFKGITKVILYTIVPVGVTTYLPARIIFNFNLELTLIVLFATILIVLLAYTIFNIGLKRYSSSNLMSARL